MLANAIILGALLGGLWTAIVVTHCARRLRRAPRILLLHALSTRSFDFTGISFAQFESLLTTIEQSRLRVGTIDEALRDRSVVAITFDDGYDDLMQLAPLLKARPFPVTVFMPTRFVGADNSWDHWFVRGRRRHLSAEQMKSLANLGVEFGSHGHTHSDLSKLEREQIESELRESNQRLTEITGVAPRFLAYPFGRFDAAVVEAARSLGFERAVAASVRSAGEFSLGRIAINHWDTEFTMRAKLRGGIIGAIELFKARVLGRFSSLTSVFSRS